jgi:hypothetical protein
MNSIEHAGSICGLIEVVLELSWRDWVKPQDNRRRSIFEASSSRTRVQIFTTVDPVPDPLLVRKYGDAENRTQTSGSVARNSGH